MSHPFTTFFERALKKSLMTEENEVLIEAEKLLERGYPAKEIHGVLKTLANGLINADDEALVREAEEALASYLK